MVRAYAITSDAVAAERARVDDDLSQVDISRVVQLDAVELRTMGPRDVHLRILAVSAEHNVDHAALADTVNIAELRGGKMYPGQLRGGRGDGGRKRGDALQARRRRAHALQR